MTEAKPGGKQLASKENQGLLGTTHSQERGSSRPTDTLTSDIWPPELKENSFLFV